MHIQQFVMAYGVEQDRLRALLPEGFTSLRPVLRVNAEIRDGRSGYVEFNTAAEKDGLRGWLNIGFRTDVPFTQSGKTTTFRTDLLEIRFTGVGVAGSCPAEKDNAGCFFLTPEETLRAPELITANKESSATVHSAGCCRRAPTASASARPCPPTPAKSSTSTPRSPSPWKTPPASPAGRCWIPIRWNFSGNHRKLSLFGGRPYA